MNHRGYLWWWMHRRRSLFDWMRLGGELWRSAVSLANWLNTDLKGQCINTSQWWNVNIVSWIGKTDYRRRNERLKIGEQEIEGRLSRTQACSYQCNNISSGSTETTGKVRLFLIKNRNWIIQVDILLLLKYSILVLLLMAKELIYHLNFELKMLFFSCTELGTKSWAEIDIY